MWRDVVGGRAETRRQSVKSCHSENTGEESVPCFVCGRIASVAREGTSPQPVLKLFFPLL